MSPLSVIVLTGGSKPGLFSCHAQIHTHTHAHTAPVYAWQTAHSSQLTNYSLRRSVRTRLLLVEKAGEQEKDVRGVALLDVNMLKETKKSEIKAVMFCIFVYLLTQEYLRVYLKPPYWWPPPVQWCAPSASSPGGTSSFPLPLVEPVTPETRWR